MGGGSVSQIAPLANLAHSLLRSFSLFRLRFGVRREKVRPGDELPDSKESGEGSLLLREDWASTSGSDSCDQ